MHLNDFSDRISPMLVKELRQGLRTRSFIGVFLTLQIFLALILLGAGTSATSDRVGDIISNIIFSFFGVAVLILQPLRGTVAISSEIKSNTIDMLVLTRLSSWRIVYGKWSAIVGQSALILVTMIPYLILRYFFGGMNLMGELILLTFIFICSAGLTAMTIALSATNSILLRTVVPVIGLVFFGLFGLIGFSVSGELDDLIQFCSLDTVASQITISSSVVAVIYYGYFCISASASLIAPHAENHSTNRRILALVFTLAAIVTCHFYLTEPEAYPFILGLIFAPPFALSLTESTILIAPTRAKFTRAGFIGKSTSIFFSPGWASGYFFCLLLSVIGFIGLYAQDFSNVDQDYFFGILAYLSTFFSTALIVTLLKIKGTSKLAAYLLILTATSIGAMVLLGISEATSSEAVLYFFSFIPLVSLALFSETNDTRIVSLIIVASAIIYIIALFIMAIRSYRHDIKEADLTNSENP